MIYQVQPEQIPSLLELLQEFYHEQKNIRLPLDLGYLKNGLEFITKAESYFTLSDEKSNCIMCGHVDRSFLFKDLEGYEDVLYIRKGFRKGFLFYRLIKQFEIECSIRGAKVLHLRTASGINDDVNGSLYERLGYYPYSSGYKKEI